MPSIHPSVLLHYRCGFTKSGLLDVTGISLYSVLALFLGSSFLNLGCGTVGPNGYPVSPLTDCVAPVAPEDWLATYTNTIEQV